MSYLVESTLDICLRCQLPMFNRGGGCRLCALGPGSVLGPFQVQHKLGEGALGRTYACTRTNGGETFAVKLLSNGPTAERPSLIERFHRDSRLAAQICHPNLVAVQGTGHWNSCPFVVMERLEGSVEDRLRSQGRLDPATALAIVRDAAQGLAAACDRGLLHRDVKPSNLLFDAAGRTKVSDFGIAAPAGDPLDGMHHGPLLLGTAAYMAPEQAQGRSGDNRSDIYSLGITLYRLLTGRLPFSGSSSLAILVKQVIEPLPPLEGIDPAVAELIFPMLRRMTAKLADDRHPSYAGLIADLGQLEAELASWPLALKVPA